MATIITRLYENEGAANAVAADLKADRNHGYTSTVVTKAAALDDAGIGEERAAAYRPLVEKGNALLVVEALLGQARGAIEIVDGHPAIDAGVGNENTYVETVYKKDMSKLIMRDHPHMMTPEGQSPVFHGTKRFGAFLVPLLSSRTPPDNAVYRGTKRFGDFLVPLLSDRKPVGQTVFHGTKRFGDFLVPLLSGRKPKPPTVYHGTKRFGDFLLPLILRRDGTYAPD